MLSPDKKRVSLTFTKKAVAEFQEITKELGFPQSIMSIVCQDALEKTTKIFKEAKRKGSITMADLVHWIGEELESYESFERQTGKEIVNGEVKTPKAKKVAKTASRKHE